MEGGKKNLIEEECRKACLGEEKTEKKVRTSENQKNIVASKPARTVRH